MSLAVLSQLAAKNATRTVWGRNTVVGGTGVTEDITDAGGTFAFPTQARLHNVVSGSANDAAAGTGARTIRIHGLDETYDEVFERLTLNGITNVSTAIAYRHIYDMRVLTAGSGGTAAGNITATAVTDATVSCQISAGIDHSRYATWTTPRGFEAQIAYGYISTNAAADVFMLIQPFSDDDGLYHEDFTGEAMVAQNGTFEITPQSLISVGPRSRFRVRATSISGNTDVGVRLGLVLRPLGAR